MSTVSTHVLDAVLGRPAAGVEVELSGPGVHEQARTDDDGRVRFAATLAPGVHRITFATGTWFAAAGRETFHPQIDVTFAVSDEPHHHVALLLSPFAYTTYRGS